MDSEQRARELLAEEATEAGWPRWAAAIREGRTDSVDTIAIKAIARALEQREAGSKGREVPSLEWLHATHEAWISAWGDEGFIEYLHAAMLAAAPSGDAP